MIKVLDKQTADKIAAGEVIERPVSIVKELVENSIDSGASSITVEIRNGGKTYIRVTDDGCGINSNETTTAFLRHATSKIEKAKDLNSIVTLGFRGEALASVAAVTCTELITKEKDAKTGSRVIVTGGTVTVNEPTGCPDGTTIIVTDLFYNTPARLKFMKSDQAEASQIIDFMNRIALCYVDLKIRLINNGKVIFSTSGDGRRLNAILRVYPEVSTKDMVPLNYQANGYKISGYTSTPVLSKTSRSSQIYFVNGRAVNSKVIEKGVSLGYKERLFEGRYPVCFLFLEVDPSTIDVNIHPNKKDVRFGNEGETAEFIAKALVRALSSEAAISDASQVIYSRADKTMEFSGIAGKPNLFKDTDYRPDSENNGNNQLDIKSILSSKLNQPDMVSEFHAGSGHDNVKSAQPDGFVHRDTHVFNEDLNISYKDNCQGSSVDSHCGPANDNAKASACKEPVDDLIELSSPSSRPFDFASLEITGCIFDTYITATDEKSFYLIDQHACQERIFYEKLVGEYDASQKNRQALILPLMINVNPKEASDESKWLNPLQRMGYTIENFGQNTYRVSEIPMFMDLTEADDFLRNFIDSCCESIDNRNRVVVDKLIMMSCKAAIKAHDHLNLDEMKALLKDLSLCRNPFSCPHGRPTAVRLTEYELERMFKRA